MNRLIIIDASENMQSIFEIALEGSFDLTFCLTVESVLIEVCSNRPDAILFDPLSVNSSLLAMAELSSIPQIACSIRQPSPVVSPYITAYIQKPFDPIQLPAQILEIIEQTAKSPKRV